MQIPVALDETNGDEIFCVCASANMAIFAIEMTKLEINGDLVMLQPGSSQLFSEKDLTMKYEVKQSSMNSFSFIVFHYYLEGGMDVAHNTTTNALFYAEIRMLQFFEDDFSSQGR